MQATRRVRAIQTLRDMAGSPRPAKRAALLLALLLWLLPLLAVGDGSWVATAPQVRVVMSARESLSHRLTPPAPVPAGSRIHSVSWRCEAPLGRRVRGRLCHQEACLRLSGARGRSLALAGLPADKPLHFRFALAPGLSQAVVVKGLQVIVNYQRP
jgi:flagellar protein FlhE